MKERLDEAEALTRAAADEHSTHQSFPVVQDLIGKRIDVARGMVKAREDGGLEGARQQFGGSP